MRADLRFYAELRDFLAPRFRSGRVTHTFQAPANVKDVIESYGVPHTEVELIMADGASVDFSYRLADGDRISVYPAFEAFDVGPLIRLRPEPMRTVRFVLDVHLGRLARHLRLLGFDTSYARDRTDAELVAISTGEQRILLTRDLGLLKHRAVTHGCYVRSTDPRRQLIEVVRRLHLSERIEPFSRCLDCNGLLERVAKAQVEPILEPMTREQFDDFRRCTSCGKVYWEGSHVGRLEAIVAEARGA
jgi:hypothetical protein